MYKGIVPAVLIAAVLVCSGTAGSASTYRFLELPAWSPDGTKIAWASQPIESSGGSITIWTANADGSSPKQLIGGFRNGLTDLVWPQPTMLLYDANFDVTRIGLDRSHKVIIAATGSGFAADTRGDWVASSCDQCQTGPLTVANTQTGKRYLIGAKGTSNGDASFSPDGSRIVFNHATLDASTGRITNGGLWIVNRDGTNLHSLNLSGACASWSPSGNLIAYLKPSPAGIGLALHTITTTGAHDRMLIRRGPDCSAPASFAWSPNGKSIAYEGGNGRTLFVVNVATGRTTKLKQFTQVSYLAWSPDSTRLLVTAPSDCPSLWRVDANGADAQKLFHC